MAAAGQMARRHRTSARQCLRPRVASDVGNAHGHSTRHSPKHVRLASCKSCPQQQTAESAVRCRAELNARRQPVTALRTACLHLHQLRRQRGRWHISHRQRPQLSAPPQMRTSAEERCCQSASTTATPASYAPLHRISLVCDSVLWLPGSTARACSSGMQVVQAMLLPRASAKPSCLATDAESIVIG